MRISIAFILTLLLPATAFSQQVGRDQATWTWEGRVDNGRWFQLSSVNGPVTIERSTDNAIHVRAEKEVKRGEITDVAFQVVEYDGNVRICAIWRDDVCEADGLRSPRRRNRNDDRTDVRVKFTIRVPAGVRIDAGTVNGALAIRDAGSEVRASTVNGSVEVHDGTGQVRATTVNGGVKVNTRTGPVSATTVNGNIDVRMTALQGDGSMRFKTVNGSVTVELPRSLQANVEMQTLNGSFTSDYPIQISGRFGPRRASGTIGNGGRLIELEALNGSLHLKAGS